MSELNYRGVPVEEMSKEELIEALKLSYDMYLKSMEDHQKVVEQILG